MCLACLDFSVRVRVMAGFIFSLFYTFSHPKPGKPGIYRHLFALGLLSMTSQQQISERGCRAQHLVTWVLLPYFNIGEHSDSRNLIDQLRINV